MNKSFIDDEAYEEEEEMDDEIEDDIELEIFEDDDDDLNQISSYWKSDQSSDGYGRKKRTTRFIDSF